MHALLFVCLWLLIKAWINVLYNHASSELYSEQCHRDRERERVVGGWTRLVGYQNQVNVIKTKVLDYKSTQLNVTYMVQLVPLEFNSVDKYFQASKVEGKKGFTSSSQTVHSKLCV